MKKKVESVMITAKFKRKKSITSYCGGLKINDFILINGLVLEPFMFAKLMEHLQQIRNPDKNVQNFSVSRKTIEDYKLKLPPLFATVVNEAKTSDKNGLESDGYTGRECDVALIWKYDLLRDAIKSNLLRCKFQRLSSSLDESGNTEERVQLLSTFLILKIRDSTAKTAFKLFDESLISFMSDLLDLCQPSIFRGSSILTISTPFFLRNFLNSWHKGILSNLVGTDDCLLLVDAELPPDSEGAILMSNDFIEERNIVGMIVTNSVKFEDEQFGFCLAVNFKSLATDFLQRHKPSFVQKQFVHNDISYAPYKNQIRDLIVENFDACVALISTNQSWGTGVVISLEPGLILTCSHVVNKKQDISISIGNFKSLANVVYSTPVGRVYDIAILSFKPNDSIRKINFTSMPLKQGEPVYTAGFPLFKSDRPSISAGIISHVNKHEGPILTSCCLHSGGSGAPLFRQDGSLLGIMTCFLCSTNEKSQNFPRLSLAISSLVFHDCLDKFIRTQDVNDLSELTCYNPDINKLWIITSSNFFKSHL